MKKKFLSFLTAVSLGLSSITVLAATQTPSKGETKVFDNPDGIELNKTLTNNGDGQYTLNLEAYTTGAVSTTTSVKPTDIVLVLDRSKSMILFIEVTKNKNDLSALKPEYAEHYRLRDVSTADLITYKMRYNSGIWEYSESDSDVWQDVTSFSNEFVIEIERWFTLELAVEDFIDRALAASAENKIAIVSFSDSGIDESGGLQDNSNFLKQCVENLNYIGSTAPDTGLKLAKDILINAESDNRNQAVVMFTDGKPNKTSSMEKAIQLAYEMKKAKIYTVGIFDNADPNDLKLESNKYMNYVSSNYPDAQGLKVSGVGSNQGYYLSADNATRLDDIFREVSTTITKPTSDSSMDATTVVRDTVSDYFELQDNSVTAQIVKCIGYENGVYTWDKTGTAVDKNNITVDGATKTISVTGFDYDTNVVTQSPKSDGTYGSKLVFNFQVEPLENFVGGNNVPSNKEKSGIYLEGESEPLGKFPQPSDNIELKHNIQIEDQTIYRGDAINYKKLFQMDGEIINGINNAFVNITYSIYEDENGEPINTVTIPAGTPAGSISEYNLQVIPKTCTNYIVKYSVTPSTEASSQGVIPITDKQEPFTIHVLQPDVHVNDLYVNYGIKVDLLDDCAKVDWETATEHTHEDGSSIPSVTAQSPPRVVLTFTDEDGVGYTTEDFYNKGGVKEDKTFKITKIETYDSDNQKTSTIDVPREEQKVFHIYLNRYDLNITKNVDETTWEKNGQNLIVNVKQNNTTTKVVFNKNELSDGTETKTITGLYAALPTTVEEEVSWSWRWTPSYSWPNAGDKVQVENNVHTVVGVDKSKTKPDINNFEFYITNTIKDEEWISLSEMIQNIFGQNGGVD